MGRQIPTTGPQSVILDVPEPDWTSLNIDGAVSLSLSNGTIGGLSLAWKQGFRKLLVRSDSKHVVGLVNSASATSSILSLVCAIHCLRKKCLATIVSWVPRDDTRPANVMAKLVNSPDFSLHVYFEPSLGVDLLLNNDKNRL
ncbi:hypothetical protein V6N11_058978 [Hibiscus sabdariffa]|uniref:RNase H type-1 domain-containing protein n=1 Tax=Hibiscus sabdariffa TaxID=183260 RepID=A0ABR2U5S4_9ROSI